jgi:hypothetical protein
MSVYLILHLLTGKANFIRVQDDNKISRVGMRRVRGFIFTPENSSDFRTKATYNLSFCINNIPLMLNRLFVGVYRLVTKRIHCLILFKMKEIFLFMCKASAKVYFFSFQTNFILFFL